MKKDRISNENIGNFIYTNEAYRAKPGSCWIINVKDFATAASQIKSS